MQPYLVTATDRTGKRDTFARPAASVPHLRAALELDGYTDIELLDDELSVRLRAQRPAEARPVTAADYRWEAKLQRGVAPASMWPLAALRKSLLPFLVMAAMASYGVAADKPIWIAAGVALLVLWVWAIQRGVARAQRYDALLRAFARGEWDESARLIDRLRLDPALAGNGQLQADLGFRAASLRAVRGELEAALADVAALRSSEHAAGGMFESRVASVHYLAGDIPGFLQGLEQGWEASGRAQLQQLDLAFAQARVGDTARARELLAGVDPRNLSTLHRPIALAVAALATQRDGDDAAATPGLAEAVDGLAAFGANPAVWPLLGILLGHLALALARTGERAHALAILDGWRDVVDACLDPDNRRALAAALA